MAYSATPGAIIRIGVDGAAQSRREIDTVARTMSNLSATVQSAMRNLAASVGIGAGVAGVVQMSDEYAKFTAQLRLATQSQREYGAAYADVKRIANDAQQGLASTGVLYARIANGTRELGTTQKQVAAITEVVNMSLKVSGATASESASAQLQLAQAFASGTLRGEEFNAVNEAAPRLMLALADGIGVPVGALKKMAEEGQITSVIMADVLPKALATLREEAKQVQTIGGAFTVLKNNAMEFVGVQAQSSGVVAGMTTAIEALADNLKLVALAGGAVAIVFGGRMAAAIATATAEKVKSVAASIQQARAAELAAAAELRRAQAERQSALIAQSRAREAVVAVRAEVAADQQRVRSAAQAAEAAILARQAQFAETANIIRSEIALEQRRHAAQINSIGRAARVSEMARLATQLNAIEKAMAAESAKLAATRIANEQAVSNAAATGAAKIAAAREAEVVATAGAAAATLRMRVATAALTAAMGAASIAAGVLRGAMALLGGPVGAVITLLSFGAIAWTMWGDKAKEGNDKALESTEETGAEMIARLDKQIEKLRERNRLADTEPRLKGINELSDADRDGLARSKAALDANRAAQKNAMDDRARMLLQLEEIDLLHTYETQLQRVTTVQDEMTNAAKRTRGADLKEWYGQHGTAAQKLEYELEGLRKKFGTIPPEMEKLVRARYADKGAAATITQEAGAYAKLMTSIREKIAANELEAAGYSKMTDAQKMTIQLDAAIGTGKNKLSEKHIAEARAQIALVEAQDAALLSAANVKKAVQDLDDDRNKAYESAMAEATANEELVATYGMTKLQIEQLSLARDEDRLARRASLDLDEKEVAHLERMIAAKRRNMTAVGKVDALEQGSDLTKAKELLDVMTSIDEVTRQAAAGMAESFGRVGAAIGDMTTSLSGYGRAQAAIAAQLAAEKKDAKNDPVKIRAAEARASQAAATAQIRQYGDMAKAAKGFFKENTAGYKVMEGAEKAFRAYEMAMSIKSMVEKSGLLTAFTGLFVASKATQTAAEGTATAASAAMAGTQASAWGVTAVVKAIASMPFPLNIAAGAATLAAVVAIGAKMFGSLGGGGKSLSESRQETQGTGSVLGKPSAKSESIARSLELAASNSSIELNYTAGMLRSLQNIESSIGGLGNLMAQNGLTGTGYGSLNQKSKWDNGGLSAAGAIGGGVAGALAGGAVGSVLAMPVIGGSLTALGAVAGPIGMLIGGLLGAIGGSFIGKLGAKVFGGKQTVEDTGLTLGAQSLASIAQSGVNAQSYTDIKKDGGWFHSDKRRTESASLGAEMNQQFGAVITGMADAVKQAGSLLGLEGDQFNERLSSFVVNVGKISIKDLDAEGIQKELEAVFSKVGDDMARWGVQGLSQFQKVGEGYLETLVRVATNYANVDASLRSIGMEFGATGLASIAARENLVELTGGIDSLAGKAASFGENFLTEQERLAPLQKYVTDQLVKMNLGYIDTREEFKNHVLGLTLVTEAERQEFAQLMDLESAFAKVTAQTKDLSRSAQDIADERADLQSEWDDLMLTAAEKQAKAREAIDPSNRALFDQIALQRSLKESTEAASDALKTAVERLGDTRTSALAYRDSLLVGNLSTLTPMQKYIETQRQYNEALLKAQANPSDSAAASAAQTAATAFLTASQVVNASSAAFIGDKSKVMSDMGQLAAIAGQQMTDAQRQLSALDKQVVGIAQLNDTAAAIEQAILNQSSALPVVGIPAFDVQRYASGSSAAADTLAAEVKGLRAEADALRRSNADILAELKLLRTDANRNANDIVDGLGTVGETVSSEVGEAIEQVAYRANNPTRVAPR